MHSFPVKAIRVKYTCSCQPNHCLPCMLICGKSRLQWDSCTVNMEPGEGNQLMILMSDSLKLWCQFRPFWLQERNFHSQTVTYGRVEPCCQLCLSRVCFSVDNIHTFVKVPFSCHHSLVCQIWGGRSLLGLFYWQLILIPTFWFFLFPSQSLSISLVQGLPCYPSHVLLMDTFVSVH